MRVSNTILLVLAVILGGIVGAGLRGCNGAGESAPSVQVVRDTLILRDMEQKTVVRYVQHTDTAVIVVRDTLRDTLRIYVPIEYSHFADTLRRDSIELRVGVDFHGWRAGIDSLRLEYDIKPRYIVQEKKRGFGQFVGIGLGVGAGMGVVNNTPFAAPVVGVHFVYGFGYHF